MALNTIMIIAGAGIAAMIALLFALPSKAVVERVSIINAQPETIYELLSSNQGYQRFNPYKDTDPNLEIILSGPERGVGSSFSFKGKEGEGTQTIIAMEENKSVTVEIDLGAMGKPETTFLLKAVPEGTQVHWQTTSNFGMNPIGRVFGLFLDNMLGKVYERGLVNLNAAVAV